MKNFRIIRIAVAFSSLLLARCALVSPADDVSIAGGGSHHGPVTGNHGGQSSGDSSVVSNPDGGLGDSNSGNANGDDGGPRGCTPPGEKRCNGDIVEECTADGDWTPAPDADQCGGNMPACTGNGVCAAFRLVRGTLDTFGSYAASGSSYVLRRQTLLEYSRTCNQSYCVTGGITP